MVSRTGFLLTLTLLGCGLFTFPFVAASKWTSQVPFSLGSEDGAGYYRAVDTRSTYQQQRVVVIGDLHGSTRGLRGALLSSHVVNHDCEYLLSVKGATLRMRVN